MQTCLSHISLACAVLFAGITCSPAATLEDTQQTTFPLMAWDYAADAQTLTEMAQCGITQVAFVPDELAVLDLCTSLGLQAIVFDESLSGDRWNRAFDHKGLIDNLPAVINKVG